MNKEDKLKWAIALALIFMLIEITGGLMANSLAILSDAAHLLSDIAGFVISLISIVIAKTPGSKVFTYGLARVETFGALLSIFSLWAVTIILLYESFNRAKNWYLGNESNLDGKLMFIISVFGVFVNVLLLTVFHEEHGEGFGHSHDGHSHGHGHDHNSHEDSIKSCSHDNKNNHSCSDKHDHHDHSHDIEIAVINHSDEKSSLKKDYQRLSQYESVDNNYEHHHIENIDSEHNHNQCTENNNSNMTDANLEAAYYHVITDLLQSVGVAVVGLIIWFYPNLQILDPICTIIFSIVVVITTVPLVTKGFIVLLEGKPSNIDWELLEQKMRELPNVLEVSDLHIWSLSPTSTALTVHIKAKNPQLVLRQAHQLCKSFGISHSTIQVQDDSDDSKYLNNNSNKCVSLLK